MLLALDLGTTTGWALFDTRKGSTLGALKRVGVWDLKARGAGMLDASRFVALRSNIFRMIDTAAVDHVAFEFVSGHFPSFNTSQLFGGFTATVVVACYDRKLAYAPVNQKTVKRIATGNGNAKKVDVIQAAREQWPNIRDMPEHIADALWVGECCKRAEAEWFRPRWGEDTGAVEMVEAG